MEPEVIENNPYSFPADVWNCGCVIYEIMTLKPLFVAYNIIDLIPKIIKGDYHHLKKNIS
jgi:NIMA (never in mitosis gene a)-related kinase